MEATPIILSVTIATTGLVIAIAATIKGFHDAKKYTNEMILRRKERYLKDFHTAN